jgi:hypothetical protein
MDELCNRNIVLSDDWQIIESNYLTPTEHERASSFVEYLVDHETIIQDMYDTDKWGIKPFDIVYKHLTEQGLSRPSVTDSAISLAPARQS